MGTDERWISTSEDASWITQCDDVGKHTRQAVVYLGRQIGGVSRDIFRFEKPVCWI